MRLLRLIAMVLFLVGCNHPTPSDTLTVGTIAGPETDMMEVAKQVALKRYGLKVRIVEFTDYALPNAALQDGSLDANVFQHLAYLQTMQALYGYNLEVIGKTFVYPSGIYSLKTNNLADLPQNALIAIPNDPSNAARALLLLEKSGLIRLKENQNLSLKDIVVNSKNLRFKELDAAQLPRVLPDVDAAVINTNYAIPAGLLPSKNALFLEDRTSPYANLVVIRSNSTKKEQLGLLVKALNSKEVKEKAQQLFGNDAIPAW